MLLENVPVYNTSQKLMLLLHSPTLGGGGRRKSSVSSILNPWAYDKSSSFSLTMCEVK